MILLPAVSSDTEPNLAFATPLLGEGSTQNGFLSAIESRSCDISPKFAFCNLAS